MKITILGWKRNTLPKYCYKAELLCKLLSKKDHIIITGGGTGIMESSNKGAYNVNKDNSIGISVNILKNERNDNKYKYIKPENYFMTDTFYDRKIKLMHETDINIFFPGGMGTLDEFSDLMNLYKTCSIPVKPVFLVGKIYWNTLIDWFKLNKIKFPMHLINLITDDVDKLTDIINNLKF